MNGFMQTNHLTYLNCFYQSPADSSLMQLLCELKILIFLKFAISNPFHSFNHFLILFRFLKLLIYLNHTNFKAAFCLFLAAENSYFDD